MKDVKSLYNHVISALNSFAVDVGKKVAITGQSLEDLFGLLRLMRLMVTSTSASETASTLEYLVQSVDALTQIKTLKNGKIQKEAIEVA